MHYKDIPNFLTISRILLIPFIIWGLYPNSAIGPTSSFILFLIASITDFLDGYIARKYSLQSVFGVILDPIADKMLICALLIIFTYNQTISPILSIMILIRELVISALREYLSSFKIQIPVSNLGKAKTALQMFSLGLLLYGTSFAKNQIIIYWGNILLLSATILTLWTGIEYIISSIQKLSKKNETF